MQIAGLNMSLERALSLCAYCPKMCYAVCPVALADQREVHSPWAKMWQGYRQVVHGEVIDAKAAEHYLACTGCGACTQYCEHGVEVARVLWHLRGRDWAKRPESRAATLMAQADSVLPEAAEALRARYAAELPLRAGPLALHAGSATLMQRPGLLALTHSFLLGLGLDAASPPEALFAGLGQDLLWAGLTQAFRRHGEKIVKALASVAELVCMEPEDAYILRVVYPQHGLQIRAQVLTVVEVLDQQRDRLPRRKTPAPLYHDPCFLGRHLGLLDEPRREIQAVCGQAPLEFTWHGAQSRCAGGGCGFAEHDSQLAQEMARRRWADRGAQEGVLVSACAGAEALFLRAGVACLDLVEWICAEPVASCGRGAKMVPQRGDRHGRQV